MPDLTSLITTLTSMQTQGELLLLLLSAQQLKVSSCVAYPTCIDAFCSIAACMCLATFYCLGHSCHATSCKSKGICLHNQEAFKNVVVAAGIGGYNVSTIALISAAVTIAMIGSLPNANWGLPDPKDTLPWEWNANGVASYWSRRPVAVARRSVAVTLAGVTVGVGLLLDRAAGGRPKPRMHPYPNTFVLIFACAM